MFDRLRCRRAPTASSGGAVAPITWQPMPIVGSDPVDVLCAAEAAGPAASRDAVRGWADDPAPAFALWRSLHRLDQRAIGVSVDVERNGPAALALASVHPDGHVREAALRHILRERLIDLLPLVVLRTVDWVPQVSTLARTGLLAWLHDGPRDAAPRCLPAAVSLERRFGEPFARVQVSAAVWDRPREPWERYRDRARPDAVRRAAFDIALRAHAVRPGELSVIADDDRDGWVRLRAAEAAVRDAVWRGDHRPIERALRSRSGRVRALGVTGLLRVGRGADAVAFVDDESPAIRAMARAGAREAGIDAVEHYRTVVTGGDPLPGAVHGLVETGVPGDAVLIAALTTHRAPRVRAAALRGLRALGAPAPPDAVDLLRDPSARVVREAEQLLRPTASTLPLPLVWSLLRDPRPVVRRAGHGLAMARDPHTRLLAES